MFFTPPDPPKKEEVQNVNGKVFLPPSTKELQWVQKTKNGC